MMTFKKTYRQYLVLSALTLLSGCVVEAQTLKNKPAMNNSVSQPIPNSAQTVEPFTLSQVQLLESPFKAAMERNGKYLLELDGDRLLHNTRKYAGLEPKGALYGGWEARGIAGHTLGHYLTALSQQYAATGDQRFQERIAYIVNEMATAQKAYGDGYVGARNAHVGEHYFLSRLRQNAQTQTSFGVFFVRPLHRGDVRCSAIFAR